jgi:hypothetical protein
MKRLKSVENDQVQLEVVECDCGFHLGIDATYLVQVGDCVICCPSCCAQINTAVVFPEEEQNEPSESSNQIGPDRGVEAGS